MLCANLSVLYTVHYSGNWAYDSDSSIVTLMLLMCMVGNFDASGKCVLELTL